MCTALAVAVALNLVAIRQVSAGDTPEGFWWGSDSNYPTATGTKAPFLEPYNSSGSYGGYFAEVDTYFDQKGCGSGRAVNSTNVADANANSNYDRTYGVPESLGTALYYYGGGPGVDPNYNGTTTEAYAWGQLQATKAYQRYEQNGPSVWTPLMLMDIDVIYGDGWNDVKKHCSDQDVETSIPYAVDRATFNGFWDYIYNSTPFYPGVYSSPSIWDHTFGTGSYGTISNTFEWTNESETGSYVGPSAWCSGSTCASWYGSTTKKMAWQWSTPSQQQYDNPPENYGDFDQIDMCTWDLATC